jgi:hypothetical protein
VENWFEEGAARSFRTGQIYKSAFSYGYILCGVEEMTPTLGDVYVISMTDRWCGKHLLETTVVPLICTGLAVARPWNLRT